MALNLSPAPHLASKRSVRFIMGMVLVALLPATLLQLLFFGPGLLWQFILAALAALLCESLALTMRNKPIGIFITDGSALVTAALLALSMPPLAPWWLSVSAAVFAILLGKHVYGGLGVNPFNPAMLGYAVMLVSFPKQMTRWLPASGIELPGLVDSANAIFTGVLPETFNVDVLSAASPLSALQSGLALRHTMEEIISLPVFGAFAGRGWEWISMALLLGGLFMLALRIIRWHIPLSMLLGLSGCALLMNALDPGRHAGVLMHLFSGATMLGAFFIATDPVTAATSNRGRLIYGAGIGVLTYVIRDFGNYHDGLAFAVLLMNLSVPLIDKFTIPRIYGAAR